MRFFPASSFARIRAAQWSPLLIAAGLGLLAVAMVWPTMPAVSAVSLVALGATGATVARFRGRELASVVVMLHLTVYGSLYLLFVGAAWHAASRSGIGWGMTAAIDLAASLLPVATAIGLAVGELCNAHSPA